MGQDPTPWVSEAKAQLVSRKATAMRATTLSFVAFIVVLALGVTTTALQAETYQRPPGPREILGGNSVDHFQYPYASVVYVNSARRCTGVLVRPLWVLTAAHCVDGGTAGGTRIEFGWVDGDTSRFESQTGVVRLIAHPQYEISSGHVANDVALIRLKREFLNSLSVPYFNDNGEFRPGVGNMVRVAGWGRTGPDSYPGRLQSAEYPIAECPEEIMGGRFDRDAIICLKGTTESHTLAGDSGAPVFYQLPNDQWRVVSVDSWGHELHTATFSAYHYREWIDSHVYAAEGPSVRVEITNSLPVGCVVSVFTYNGDATYERGAVESEFTTAFAVTSDLEMEAIIHLRCEQGE